MRAIDPLARQKQRLETLADVIYGVAIVLLVSTMPTPSSVGGGDGSLLTFLAESYELLIGDAITLFLIVTYWTQNNAVNGILTRTDGRHSVAARR